MIVLRLSTFVEAVHLNDFKWILTLSIMQCNNCWILQKVQNNFFKMCVRFGPYSSGRQNEWIPGQLTELDRSEPSHLRLLCINVDLSRIFINRSHLQTDKALNSRYTFLFCDWTVEFSVSSIYCLQWWFEFYFLNLPIL